MPKSEWSQSAAERDKLLDRIDKQGSGYIFIVDLDDPEGQLAANKLKIYEDVANALAVRVSENLLHCRYMLVLMAFAAGGRAVVAFSAAEHLRESMELVNQRSRDFGDLFAVVVCPTNPEINALFTQLQETAGSA